MAKHGPLWFGKVISSFTFLDCPDGYVGSYMVLYVLVLSCIVLSGPVWSYLAMSGPLWNCTVFLSSMVFYDNVLYCAVLYCPAFSCTVQSTMVLCTPVGYCMDPVRPSMFMYGLLWLSMVQYGPVWSCVEVYVLSWSYIVLHFINVLYSLV